MEYVVTKKRLRDYLYSLGFYYRKVPDKTGKQDEVWLFPKNDLLLDAITYYTKMKNIRMNGENKLKFYTP